MKAEKFRERKHSSKKLPLPTRNNRRELDSFNNRGKERRGKLGGLGRKAEKKKRRRSTRIGSKNNTQARTNRLAKDLQTKAYSI